MGLFGFGKKKETRNPEDCRYRPLDWFSSDEGQSLYAKAFSNAKEMIAFDEESRDNDLPNYNLTDFITKPIYLCKWYREFLCAYARESRDFAPTYKKVEKAFKKFPHEGFFYPQDAFGLGGLGEFDSACLLLGKLDYQLWERKANGKSSEDAKTGATPNRCQWVSDPESNPVIRYVIHAVFPPYLPEQPSILRYSKSDALYEGGVPTSGFVAWDFRVFTGKHAFDPAIKDPADSNGLEGDLYIGNNNMWENTWDNTHIYFSYYGREVILYLMNCLLDGKDTSEEKWMYDPEFLLKAKTATNPYEKVKPGETVLLSKDEIEAKMRAVAKYPEELPS